MRTRSLRPLVVLALALAALLAGCAPPAPVGLETLEVLTRTQAQQREHRLRVCEASATLRVESRAIGRLPAVSVTARLAEPGRVRMQARWLLGVLLDAALAGDTLTAWMPTEKLGLRVLSLGDTLGVEDPAVFILRALAAGWQPPREAWRGATADSAGASLAWKEQGRDWSMRVDRSGRPRDVVVSEDGHSVSVRYAAWRGAGTEALPARLVFTDETAEVQVRVDLEDLRPLAQARPEWFALVLPAHVAPLGLDDLRRVLAKRDLP